MMTATRTRNPFRPGNGQRPPYLAGREKEQNRLREILADMADGDSPHSDIVMYGPRGMGKTVLLNWIKNEVNNEFKNIEYGEEDNFIRISLATPDDFTTPRDMWGFLLADTVLQKLMPDKKEASLAGFLTFGWTKKDATNKVLVDTLIEECKKQPLVFLLDEAHNLESDHCRTLLNISQKVRKEAPFLLVLAGTPGLAHFLSTVGASVVS